MPLRQKFFVHMQRCGTCGKGKATISSVAFGAGGAVASFMVSRLRNTITEFPSRYRVWSHVLLWASLLSFSCAFPSPRHGDSTLCALHGSGGVTWVQTEPAGPMFHSSRHGNGSSTNSFLTGVVRVRAEDWHGTPWVSYERLTSHTWSKVLTDFPGDSGQRCQLELIFRFRCDMLLRPSLLPPLDRFRHEYPWRRYSSTPLGVRLARAVRFPFRFSCVDSTSQSHRLLDGLFTLPTRIGVR